MAGPLLGSCACIQLIKLVEKWEELFEKGTNATTTTCQLTDSHRRCHFVVSLSSCLDGFLRNFLVELATSWLSLQLYVCLVHNLEGHSAFDAHL